MITRTNSRAQKSVASQRAMKCSRGHGAFQRFPQSRGLLGQHVDDLAEVAAGGGLRQAEAGAEAAGRVGTIISVHVIARPHSDVEAVLPKKK